MDARSMIKEAFYILCQTKNQNKISVHAIIEKAGVNRSTFYYYFRDKQDLTHQLEEELLKEFKDVLPDPPQEKFESIEEFVDYAYPIIFQLCTHIKHQKQLYKVWLNSDSFLKRMSDTFVENLSRHSENEMYSLYMSYGSVAYLRRWVSEDCPGTVEQLASEMLKMSTHSFLTSNLQNPIN